MGAIKALDGVTVDINRGDVMVVIGPSGSGKSTFAKQVNGILLPTEGTVWISGMKTTDENHIWDIRKTAGMVFQNPDNQIIGNIVEEDVGFGPENLGVPTDEIWRRVDESLEAVGMTAYRMKSPNKLSGGQKQRLSIARALVKKPEILILDDSASALDYATDAALRKSIREMPGETTVFIVSQRASSLLHADLIIVLDDGEMADIGTHDELLERCEVYQEIYYSQYPKKEAQS